MYAFVDRPVAGLTPGAKFVLWAMRGWIHAAAKGTCPPGQLAPAFARHGVLHALPHVHRFIGEINRNGRDTLALAPLCHVTVTEDEAVLLQLWHDAARCPPRAQATLALILETDTVGAALGSLLSASTRLVAGGLVVDVPEDAPAAPRD